MKATLLLATVTLFTLIPTSVYAVDARRLKVQYVYGTGWEIDGGWLTPMTEQAADTILAAEAAKKTKLVCDVKGVLKAAEFNTNVLDYLAYSITNCQ